MGHSPSPRTDPNAMRPRLHNVGPSTTSSATRPMPTSVGVSLSSSVSSGPPPGIIPSIQANMSAANSTSLTKSSNTTMNRQQSHGSKSIRYCENYIDPENWELFTGSLCVEKRGLLSQIDTGCFYYLRIILPILEMRRL